MNIFTDKLIPTFLESSLSTFPQVKRTDFNHKNYYRKNMTTLRE